MKQRKSRRGVTLLEIMIGVFVLSMTIVTTTAMFSSSALLRNRSGGFSRAAAIVNRKLEQIRKLDASQINVSGLTAAGIIDATASGTTSFTFTTVDQLSNELVEPSSALTITGAGTDLVRVDVSVSWRGFRGKAETMTAATYVADKTAWREP